MTVISISITESSEQIVSGIPRSVALETNIPSTIFYTLDGSDPTLYTNIYIEPIQLPTDKTILVLKIFATDGVDSSAVVTNTYLTNTLDKGARTSHSATNAPANSTQGNFNLQPFGSYPIQPNQTFLGAAEAGLTVDNPALAETPTGFDGEGNPVGFTNGQNMELPSPEFPFLYSETDDEGQRGAGIGTLPKSSVFMEPAPAERSDINSAMFDPRALVIIQDLTQPTDPNVPPHINRMSFTLENVEKTRQGNQYFNCGLDAPPVSGSFVRQHFNPRNNTMTYYYFDSTQNRWIQSTIPFTPRNDQFNYASRMVLRKNNGPGSNRVFQWVPFKASYLY